MTNVVIVTKLMKNRGPTMASSTSYIIMFHSSPVDMRSRSIIAMPKFEKLLQLSMIFPSLTSWNKNTPSTAYMKNIRISRLRTLSTEGNEQISVVINDAMFLNYFISRNILNTRRTRTTRISYGPTFSILRLELVNPSIIISAIDAITTKKSNRFQFQWKYTWGPSPIIFIAASNMNTHVNAKFISSNTLSYVSLAPQYAIAICSILPIMHRSTNTSNA